MKRPLWPVALSLVVAFTLLPAGAQSSMSHGGGSNGGSAHSSGPRSSPVFPASVFTNTHIPASVLTPGNGWNGRNWVASSNNGFRNDRDHDGDRDGHHHRRHIVVYPFYYSSYYPYGYPLYSEDDSSTYDNQPQQPAPPEPEAPAQTVFENRPGYQAPPPAPQAAAEVSQKAAAPSQPAEPQPEAVLIFKDGHQQEIGNYVIVGNTLYNLSGAYLTFKISLADLDLKATVKANEDRGVEFTLPTSKNPA